MAVDGKFEKKMSNYKFFMLRFALKTRYDKKGSITYQNKNLSYNISY